MALHTIGTNGTGTLNCLAGWVAGIAAADIAAIAKSIKDDRQFAAILGGYSAGPTAVIGTGSTHTSATLDTLAGVTGAPLTQIQVGDLVLGIGITPGTFVVAKATNSLSVTLSQAATATAAGVKVAFCRLANPPLRGIENGLLTIPNRGVLKLLPGDVAAIDAMGFPYLIPGNAISYAGSSWTFA